MPLISIIVATYNAAEVLPRLLASLAEQNCRDFEVILQDGGSRDETCAIAAAAESLPHLSLDSRTDNGIYDAWNKALERVNGQWILFLGADDQLAGPDVLAQVCQCLESVTPNVRFASGGVNILNSDGSLRLALVGRSQGFPAVLRRHMGIGHPALFHHRSLFADGGFDARLRIAGDYDFLCRTWLNETQGIALPFVVTLMASGGVSDSPRTLIKSCWENLQVARHHFGFFGVIYRLYYMVINGASLNGLTKILGSGRLHTVTRLLGKDH